MAETTLCIIRIATVDGDVHFFPGADRKEVRRLVPTTGSTLTIVNAGGACLTMALRTVAEISIYEEAGNEVLWKRPTATSPA